MKAKPRTEGLRLKAPSDLHLKDFADYGLVVPESLDDGSAFAPLDFTSISSREVGRQHSQWAVRHAHLLYLLGLVRAEHGNLRYDVKNAEARWMLKRKSKYKNKWEAEYAMGRSKRIKALRAGLSRVDARLTRYEALASSYEALRDAASREITRRLGERTSAHD